MEEEERQCGVRKRRYDMDADDTYGAGDWRWHVQRGIDIDYNFKQQGEETKTVENKPTDKRHIFISATGFNADYHKHPPPYVPLLQERLRTPIAAAPTWIALHGASGGYPKRLPIVTMLMSPGPSIPDARGFCGGWRWREMSPPTNKCRGPEMQKFFYIGTCELVKPQGHTCLPVHILQWRSRAI